MLTLFSKYFSVPEDSENKKKQIKNVVQIVVKTPQIGGPSLYVAEKTCNIPIEEIPKVYPLNKSVKFLKVDDLTYVSKISASISEIPELINTLSALGFYVYIPAADDYSSDRI